jgi:hypothetical protein
MTSTKYIGMDVHKERSVGQYALQVVRISQSEEVHRRVGHTFSWTEKH